jgi:hypothetical protein
MSALEGVSQAADRSEIDRFGGAGVNHVSEFTAWLASSDRPRRSTS